MAVEGPGLDGMAEMHRLRGPGAGSTPHAIAHQLG